MIPFWYAFSKFRKYFGIMPFSLLKEEMTIEEFVTLARDIRRSGLSSGGKTEKVRREGAHARALIFFEEMHKKENRTSFTPGGEEDITAFNRMTGQLAKAFGDGAPASWQELIRRISERVARVAVRRPRFRPSIDDPAVVEEMRLVLWEKIRFLRMTFESPRFVCDILFRMEDIYTLADMRAETAESLLPYAVFQYATATADPVLEFRRFKREFDEVLTTAGRFFSEEEKLSPREASHQATAMTMRMFSYYRQGFLEVLRYLLDKHRLEKAERSEFSSLPAGMEDFLIAILEKKLDKVDFRFHYGHTGGPR